MSFFCIWCALIFKRPAVTIKIQPLLHYCCVFPPTFALRLPSPHGVVLSIPKAKPNNYFSLWSCFDPEFLKCKVIFCTGDMCNERWALLSQGLHSLSVQLQVRISACLSSYYKRWICQVMICGNYGTVSIWQRFLPLRSFACLFLNFYALFSPVGSSYEFTFTAI